MKNNKDNDIFILNQFCRIAVKKYDDLKLTQSTINDDDVCNLYSIKLNSNMDNRIELMVPGRKNFHPPKLGISIISKKNPDRFGDYQCLIKGKPLSHPEFCQELYEIVYQSKDKKLTFNHLNHLLEETYTNGIDWNNSKNYDDDDFYLIQKLYLLTLQEDINYPNGQGRKKPFSRYYEAIYAGIYNDKLSIDEVKIRCDYNNNNDSRTIDMLQDYEFYHNQPSYYVTCLDNRINPKTSISIKQKEFLNSLLRKYPNYTLELNSDIMTKSTSFKLIEKLNNGNLEILYQQGILSKIT